MRDWKGALFYIWEEIIIIGGGKNVCIILTIILSILLVIGLFWDHQQQEVERERLSQINQEIREQREAEQAALEAQKVVDSF